MNVKGCHLPSSKAVHRILSRIITSIIIVLTITSSCESFPFGRNGGKFPFSFGDDPFLLPPLPLLLASTATKPKKSWLPDFFPNFFKPKKEETPPTIATISVNSTLLPPSVLNYAASRSGVLGSKDPASSIPEFAKYISEWYDRQGYVLNRVSGAHISGNGTCQVSVLEYKVSSSHPMRFLSVKPMVVESDGLISLKEYRRREREKGDIASPLSQLNITYIPTESGGKCRPSSKWNEALDLHPGEDFQWREEAWKRILGVTVPKVFKQVLQVSPKQLGDGDVCLELIVEESPARSLEYGLTKSLYTGAWEGEIDFEHQNLFGSAEKLGFSFKRAPTDPEPSWTLYFRDDKLGSNGAYSLEAFTDYIGDTEKEEDEPLFRRGVVFQIPRWSSRANAKLGAERVCTKKGYGEGILSALWDVGPFVTTLSPNNARQSLNLHIHSGARMKDTPSLDIASLTKALYGGVTLTAKHILPLNDNSDSTTPSLAFRHKCATSYNLPRHEANALGISGGVRGYSSKSNGPVRNLIGGTTELRVPFSMNFVKDAMVVFFGDWIAAQPDRGNEENGGWWDGSRAFRKFSVGLGVRKTIQGIPVKYDMTLTQEGKVGAFLSLGKDFDI